MFVVVVADVTFVRRPPLAKPPEIAVPSIDVAPIRSGRVTLLGPKPLPDVVMEPVPELPRKPPVTFEIVTSPPPVVTEPDRLEFSTVTAPPPVDNVARPVAPSMVIPPPPVVP